LPRDGSGNYSLPPGSAAVSGATASSTAFNTMINDLASALTGSVPRDGTGAMTGPLKTTDGTVSAPSFAFGSSANTGWYKTATGFGFAVGGVLITEVRAAGLYDGSGNAYATGSSAVTWTDVASASTTDLGAVASANLRITGTTTINSFGTVASGTTRELRFAGALTLTYNATSMILPGGASITTAANDTAIAVSLGSGNWLVCHYQRAAGTPLVGGSVAVAGTFKNLKIITTSNTAATITADSVVATDGTNFVASGTLSLTLGTGTSGANGLDTGAMANNTWYSVWAIYNGSTWSCLISTNATAPTMPGGYTYKVRLGWMRTAAAADLMRTLQYGRRAQYVVTSATNTANLPIMASGAAGTPSTPTFSSISVSTYVPTTATVVWASLSAGISSGTAIIAPNNAYGATSSSTNPPVGMITATGGATVSVSLLLESSNIYWASTAGFVACQGWEDNI